MIVLQVLKMVFAFFVEVGLTAILTAIGFIGVLMVVVTAGTIIGLIVEVIKKIKSKKKN